MEELFGSIEVAVGNFLDRYLNYQACGLALRHHFIHYATRLTWTSLDGVIFSKSFFRGEEVKYDMESCVLSYSSVIQDRAFV